jgi:alpha-L-fucosidase
MASCLAGSASCRSARGGSEAPSRQRELASIARSYAVDISMRIKMKWLAVVAVLASASTSMAQTKPATNDAIKNTVERCVEEVHQLHPSYQYFDAYYNVSTQKVEYNISYRYQESALYPFRKCMATHGLPLQ